MNQSIDHPHYREQWEHLLRVVQDGILCIDPQGLIETFNPAAEKIFDYAASEVIGRNIALLIPDLGREPWIAGTPSNFHSGDRSVLGRFFEVEGKKRDGSVFPIKLSISEIALESKPVFTAVVRDLSQLRQTEKMFRKSFRALELQSEQQSIQFIKATKKFTHKIIENEKSEKILRESEETLRTLLHSFSQGVWIVDRFLNVRFINWAAQKYFRLHGKWKLGTHSFTELFSEYPVFRDFWLDRLRRFFQNGAPSRFEECLWINDNRIWSESSLSPIRDTAGRLIAVGTIFQDTTERRLREEVLKKQNQILNQIQDAIFTTNLEGQITSANLGAQNNLGYSLDDFLGQTLTSLFPDTTSFELSWYHILGHFNFDKELEVYLKKNSGEIYPALLSLSPFQDSHGGCVGYIASFVNITRRKKAEDQIMKSLKEKELLLQEVHHRTKNNLQIISSLFNLQFRNIDDPKIAEMLRESCNRINSMAQLQEKIVHSTDSLRINVKDYVTSIAQGLLQSFGCHEGKISLLTEIDNVTLSPETGIYFGLIINELISNSLKHAFKKKAKGTVCISVRHTPSDQLELLVEDDGSGISQNFDYSQSPSLGLRLVTSLVEDQLSGSIDMTRNPGTRFKILLPAEGL